MNILRSQGLDALSDVGIAAVGLAFPGIGVGTLIGKTLFNILLSRTKAYKESLSKEIIDDLTTLADDEEFVQMFHITYQSALKAHNDVKAKSFAHLLNYSFSNDTAIDELFEFNEMLSRMSIRDLYFLNKLSTTPERLHKEQKVFGKELDKWKKDFAMELSVDFTYIDSIYMKLQGYGFCRRTEHSSFMGQRFEEYWEVTSYFKRFSGFIEEYVELDADAENSI